MSQRTKNQGEEKRMYNQLLVGGASLNVSEFTKIVGNIEEIYEGL